MMLKCKVWGGQAALLCVCAVCKYIYNNYICCCMYIVIYATTYIDTLMMLKRKVWGGQAALLCVCAVCKYIYSNYIYDVVYRRFTITSEIY